MTNDLFESPHLLLQAAREELDRFSAIQNDWVQDKETASVVNKINPVTGEKTLCFKVWKTPPPSARVAAFRVVNEIKLALDQATSISIEAIGRVDEGDLYFPFRSHPTDLQRRLDRAFPSSMHDTFKAFEPYPSGEGYATGDDYLVALNYVARQKHGGVLKACVDPFGYRTDRLWISPAGGFIHSPSFDPKTGEMPIVTVPADGQARFDGFVPLYISFARGVRSPSPRVDYMMTWWLEDAIKIINEIETATKAALSA